MADIYGSHFTFGDVSSSMYGLVICNVDTSRFTKLYGDISGNTIYHKSAQKRYLISDEYADSPLTFDMEIATECGRTLDYEEYRKISKWLFNKSYYQKLYFDIDGEGFEDLVERVDGEPKRLYLNCRFVNPEKLEYNGGIVGFKCTIECDSNMFYQEETIKTFTLSTHPQTINIKIDTDLRGYTYPKVVIITGNTGGNISIINNSDISSRVTGFSDLSGNTLITMKGEINYISDDHYKDFTSPNFIRLLDGDNYLTITGDVISIRFEYQNRRAL